jgi:hypothetical protein
MQRDEVTSALMTEVGALDYMKQPLLIAIERCREATLIQAEVEGRLDIPEEKKQEALEIIIQSWRDIHSGLQEMRSGMLGVVSNLDEICAYIEQQLVSDDPVDGPELNQP